jgi:hypothetical protein
MSPTYLQIRPRLVAAVAMNLRSLPGGCEPLSMPPVSQVISPVDQLSMLAPLGDAAVELQSSMSSGLLHFERFAFAVEG